MQWEQRDWVIVWVHILVVRKNWDEVEVGDVEVASGGKRVGVWVARGEVKVELELEVEDVDVKNDGL